MPENGRWDLIWRLKVKKEYNSCIPLNYKVLWY